MKRLVIILILVSFTISTHVTAAENYNQANQYFDVDLTGYELNSTSSFNQLGNKITPLTQLYLNIVQKEEEWIEEPRLYINDDKGYVHLWKEDGTNVLYTIINNNDNTWNIVNEQRKTIDRIPVKKELLKEVVVEGLLDPISRAVNDYYQEPKLGYRGFEKVLNIEKDKSNYVFYITVQVQTFEVAHNPPYGEDTITFRIKGSNVEMINYKHRLMEQEEFQKIKLR